MGEVGEGERMIMKHGGEGAEWEGGGYVGLSSTES